MPAPHAKPPSTRTSLTADLASLGLGQGEAVFVHAGLRAVGPIVGGPDALIGALRDVVGPDGTVLAYADWPTDETYDDPAFRHAIPPFDPLTSRASRDNGAFPELLRTIPGALRSASPGASCVAIGGGAEWFIADHALDYGYGEHSPFAKLVEGEGKVLMLGAPLDTMTLLHHAEHIADFSPKRVKRYEASLLIDGEIVWRQFEEFDTSQSPDGLPEDYFIEIVEAYLATGNGKRGTIGAASSILVDAAGIVPFAVNWLERRFTPAS